MCAVLQRDHLSFSNTVDSDKSRAFGGSIDRTRVSHERHAVLIHTPDFYVEADLHTRLGWLPDHKNAGEIDLMVLSKGLKIQ